MKQTIQIDASRAIALVERKANSIDLALQLKVVSKPTYDQAGGFMAIVREAKNLLRDKKKEILDPLKLAKENIEKLFEPAEKKVEVIEVYLKDQIGGYNAKLQIEATQRAKEAEKQIEKGASLTEATKKLVNTQEKIDAIPTRKIARVRVVDFSKVPDEFKVLDELKALRANKNGVKVEGLEFYVEEIVVNRF